LSREENDSILEDKTQKTSKNGQFLRKNDKKSYVFYKNYQYEIILSKTY